MYLVNLMEQKVSKLADSYLKEKNIPINTNMRMDIIAYTLNRVQPQYVTSARGILHSYDKDTVQNNTEILSIIADACEIVARRKENTLLESVPTIDESGYYLTYPSIMGNITASNNFENIDNALVYIFCDEKILQGYGVNFPNPAVVSSNVPGKFMFCFMPKKVDTNEEMEVKLGIVVESEKFMQYENVLSFKIKPSYYNAGDMPLFSIEEVDNILLIENHNIAE
ncbi:late competence development ComFB family protein [uncultured Brachyspira sp.]|uniref:late competence development ComFB family protein n=1 Tax=uncultured Brachyspira sp. TaxID=221953 RepID=UPI0025E90381|nr:late competence development ComFB family protein [uncultured Brachyspira sp.]